MANDITHDTFDPQVHFSRVLTEQGKVQTDADAVPKPTTRKILQVAPPATAVYAVFKQPTEHALRPEEELLLIACPVVATVQAQDGSIEVVGLCIEPGGLVEPTQPNFLGYAASREEAVEIFSAGEPV